MRRALLTTISSMIALAGAGGVLAAAASPVFGIRAPTCRSLHGDAVLISTRQVTVYRGLAPGRSGIHDWACGRSEATAAPLGAQEPSPLRFPAHEWIAPIVAAGPWVAAYESSRAGFEGCPASLRMRCPVHHHQVEMIEATDGASGTAVVGARIAALRISSTRRAAALIGAVVWLQPLRGPRFRLRADVEVLRARSAAIGPTATVALGRIVPASVRLRGLRVSFVDGGHRRSVRLSG